MSRILLSSPFFGQSSAVFMKWPDLSVLRSCRAQASWLPLPPHRSMLRSSKSAAATALFPSLRAASPLTLQRSRSEKAVGPTCQAATTTLNAFHFRQALFIRCSPRQTSGEQAQHSRALPHRHLNAVRAVLHAPHPRRMSSDRAPSPSRFRSASACVFSAARAA